MNAHPEFDWSAAVDALLDRELSPDLQQRVYAELAVNEQLRDEMQCALALRAVQSRPFPPPPSQVKSAVLEAIRRVPASGITSAHRPFVSPRLWLSWIAGLVVVLVGASLFYPSDAPRILAPADTTQSRTQPRTDTAHSHGRTAERSASDSSYVARTPTRAAHASARDGVEAASGMFAEADEKLDTRSDTNSAPSTSFIAHRDAAVHRDRTVSAGQQDAIAKAQAPLPVPSPVLDTPGAASDSGGRVTASIDGMVPTQTVVHSGDGDIAVELRMFSMTSQPALSNRSASTPPVNNVAVGAYYRIEQNGSIGLELGQESIMQRYEVLSGERTLSIEQHWIAMWLGVAYMYEFTPLGVLMKTRPFVRVIAAGTASGPMVRGTGGFRIPILGNVSMRIGLEGTLLLYSQDGRVFHTRKAGITAGLTFGM